MGSVDLAAELLYLDLVFASHGQLLAQVVNQCKGLVEAAVGYVAAAKTRVVELTRLKGGRKMTKELNVVTKTMKSKSLMKLMTKTKELMVTTTKMKQTTTTMKKPMKRKEKSKMMMTTTKMTTTKMTTTKERQGLHRLGNSLLVWMS